MISPVSSKVGTTAMLSTLRHRTVRTLGCADCVSRECGRSWIGAIAGQEVRHPHVSGNASTERREWPDR